MWCRSEISNLSGQSRWFTAPNCVNVVWIRRFLPLTSMQLASTKDRSLRMSDSQLQMQESARRCRCEHRPFQSLSNGGQKRRGKRQAVTLEQKKTKDKEEAWDVCVWVSKSDKHTRGNHFCALSLFNQKFLVWTSLAVIPNVCPLPWQ